MLKLPCSNDKVAQLTSAHSTQTWRLLFAKITPNTNRREFICLYQHLSSRLQIRSEVNFERPRASKLNKNIIFSTDFLKGGFQIFFFSCLSAHEFPNILFYSSEPLSKLLLDDSLAKRRHKQRITLFLNLKSKPTVEATYTLCKINEFI